MAVATNGRGSRQAAGDGTIRARTGAWAMQTVRRHDRGWVGACGILAVAATLWASMAVAVPGVAVAAPGDRSPLVVIRSVPAGDLGLSDVGGVTFNPGGGGGLVVADGAVGTVLGVDRAGRGVPETALVGVNPATLSVDPRGDRLTGVAPGLLVSALTER